MKETLEQKAMRERWERSQKALSGEVRITDPTTGGQKGQKLQRFDLIPFEFLTALATVYGKGAQKYADDNWRKGYSWRLSLGAMLRHVALWVLGQSYDPETGEHHLAHAAWHCATLFVFETQGLGTDDTGGAGRRVTQPDLAPAPISATKSRDALALRRALNKITGCCEHGRRGDQECVSCGRLAPAGFR